MNFAEKNGLNALTGVCVVLGPCLCVCSLCLLAGDAEFDVNTVCLVVDADLLNRARTRYDSAANKKPPASAAQTSKVEARPKDATAWNAKGKGKGKHAPKSWGSSNWNKTWGKQQKRW